MKKSKGILKISLGVLLLLTVSMYADTTKTRVIIDMAGRKLTVPKVINSVYSTSPMGEVLMYSLAPSKITGKTWTPGAEQSSLMIEEYLKKPVLGGWFGKNTTGNPEVIINARPDIVLSMGMFDKTDISESLRMQEKLGIPVVMIDAKLTVLDSTYRFLGRLTGDSARADTLAQYCRNALNFVEENVKKIPSDKKVKVYYAEGLNGFETDPSGSMHTEVLDKIGVINAADLPLLQGYGRATVSIEQLLVWKPQMVLVCLDHSFAHGTENYERILSDPAWNVIDAVKKRNIYLIPSVPFNCLDRPPSVSRIYGLYWASNLIYPEYFRIDIKEETRKFYRLFYHKELNEQELNYVLKDAIRRQ